MDRQKKKISVIMPVHNVETYIGQALDSILRQTCTDWELFLIESGSTDNSLSLIRAYEKEYPSIHVVEETKRGPGACRNTGLEMAEGEYIIFIDADDYLPDTDVFDRYCSIAEQTAADIVVSNYSRLWGDRLLPAAKAQGFAVYGPRTEEFRFQGFFSVGTLSYVWGKMYRRSFLEKHKIRFADVSYAEDKLFNMQCYLSGAAYVFLDETGYVYRKNDDSISWNRSADASGAWFAIGEAVEAWGEAQTLPEEEYRGLIRYTLFFAAFFDAKAVYMQPKGSLRAVRKLLKGYGEHPLGKACFQELSRGAGFEGLKSPFWKIMLRGFSTGMRHRWYLGLSVGIKLLIDLRVDERLSDTGLRS